MDVGLGHLLGAPAGQLGEDSRRHVDDEAVRAVQEGQERGPDVLLALRGVVQEELDASAVLLRWQRFRDLITSLASRTKKTHRQEVVNHDKQVLDGGVLRDVAEKVQERLR